MKEGDLLFQDLDSSPVCDAIELVTPGYKGANFSHIGIVVASGDAFCKNVDEQYQWKYYFHIDNDLRILKMKLKKLKPLKVSLIMMLRLLSILLKKSLIN